MHLIQYHDMAFRKRVKGEYDRSEDILVGPELTESSVAATVRMKRGFETETHAHNHEEQIFIVLKGKGELTIEDETKEIEGGMAVYIPRRAQHRILALSDELVYIYISIWPEKKPENMKPKIYREGRVLNIKYETV